MSETEAGAAPEELGYEAAREQLIEVVGRLESGGTSLEESLRLWEQAEELARTASHGGLDFYPIDNFVKAWQKGEQPPMNVYRAVDTAAPAILAARSSELGGALLEVPDFRAKYGREGY